MSWLTMLWQASLTIAVLISTTITIFLATLPKQYSHFRPIKFKEQDFDEDDKIDAKRSGYYRFASRKNEDGIHDIDCSVQVVVLGDIGHVDPHSIL